MNPFKKFKEEQKELALKIRLLKTYRKEKYRETHPIPNELKTPYGYILSAYDESSKYRHRHIAYCELKGRSREQIEYKTKKGNKPSQGKIDEIKAALQLELDKFAAEVLQNAA